MGFTSCTLSQQIGQVCGARCNCQWQRQKPKGEQNRQINPRMRGEPSRGLLDASQAIYASPPRLAGSSQRHLELALRQPNIAPRGSQRTNCAQGTPLQAPRSSPTQRKCRRPGRRAALQDAPTPPGARAPRRAAARRSTARPRARRPARRRSRRAHLPNGAPSGARSFRGRRLLEVCCWIPRSIICRRLGRKRSTPNSYERATRLIVVTTWTRTARSRFRTTSSRRP